uniref:Long intergenic non-protein coding RNA 3042 n=1 Tax=Nomascus leucogenys TaxID=61853 RepID=G1RNZ9_NOMLE
MRPLGKGLLPAEELIRSNPGVGRSLRDGLSQKLAEALGSKRLKPAKFGTEGKERVEQRTEKQRTGSSKEPRMQIICRQPPPRLLWGCLTPRAQPLLHVTAYENAGHWERLTSVVSSKTLQPTVISHSSISITFSHYPPATLESFLVLEPIKLYPVSNPLCLNCGSCRESIRISGELIGNAHSPAPPRTPESETLGWAKQAVLSGAQVILMCAEV